MQEGAHPKKKKSVAGQFAAVKYRSETYCWTKKLNREHYGLDKYWVIFFFSRLPVDDKPAHKHRRSECWECKVSSICQDNGQKKRVQATRRVEHLRAQPISCTRYHLYLDYSLVLQYCIKDGTKDSFT